MLTLGSGYVLTVALLMANAVSESAITFSACDSIRDDSHSEAVNCAPSELQIRSASTATDQSNQHQATNSSSSDLGDFGPTNGSASPSGGSVGSSGGMGSGNNNPWQLAGKTLSTAAPAANPFNRLDPWGFDTDDSGGNSLFPTPSNPAPGAGNPDSMLHPPAAHPPAHDNFDPNIVPPADTNSLPGVTAAPNTWDDDFVTTVIGAGATPDLPIASAYSVPEVSAAPSAASSTHAPEPASLIVWSALACATAIGVKLNRRRQ